MRVLFLSQYYQPEPAGKQHEFAMELVSRGHTVTVITGFPNYPYGQTYPGYSQRLWSTEWLDGVKVIRLPLYPDHSTSVIRRSSNFLSFAATATLLGPLLSGPADVMWVYHPPTVGIPACWIRWLRRVPFVYEIQDMWPETVVSSGMIRKGIGIRFLTQLARFVYRQSTAITVISPGFKRNLVGKGISAEKVHVIPNWADETIYRPVPQNAELGAEFGLTGHLNIMFAGNMGPAQGLETLLQAAALLRNDPGIQFLLIGTGISLPALQAEAERWRLPNVRFIGRQPAARMPEFYAWADALLVQLRDDPLFHITIPSKSLAYLACGRPILCAVAGDGADLIRDAQAGLICSPGNPEALAAVVRQLRSMPESQREQMGQRGRNAFLSRFTRKILVDRYEELFQQVIHRRRVGGANERVRTP